jgi:hypothetical protein
MAVLNEHPILFSGPMVRALLAGRKTQTRRTRAPRWVAGDRLWVREAWRLHERFSDVARIRYQASERQSWTEQHEDFSIALAAGLKDKPGYRPSIHMPRWACRIGLTVEAVRPEPLHDISEADARAEGIERLHDGFGIADMGHDASPIVQPTAVGAYARLWNRINGEDAWAENPTVYVTTLSVEAPVG